MHLQPPGLLAKSKFRSHLWLPHFIKLPEIQSLLGPLSSTLFTCLLPHSHWPHSGYSCLLLPSPFLLKPAFSAWIWALPPCQFISHSMTWWTLPPRIYLTMSLTYIPSALKLFRFSTLFQDKFQISSCGQGSIRISLIFPLIPVPRVNQPELSSSLKSPIFFCPYCLKYFHACFPICIWPSPTDLSALTFNSSF